MQTNETLKMTLQHEAEVAIGKLLTQVADLEEGNLQGLEQQVMETVLDLGARLLGGVLSQQAQAEPAPARRQGACGHQQRLVALRPKELLTLLGKVTFQRAYYQCQVEGEDQQNSCTHGAAPADAIWGVHERRTTPGVQTTVSYLAARLTLQESAEVFTRLLPLEMSARQVLSLMQPVGEALREAEEEQVQHLWQQAQQKTANEEASEPSVIQRLYIELDGIMARLRRGSVPLEETEQKRPGDVYREVKVGAVFEATRGPERSGLAPGVFVDEPEQKHYLARRCKAEDFGKRLYALAAEYGLRQAKQVVVLGDGATWIWNLAAEHFPGAVQIVDLWHAREHVWKVAHAAFGTGSPQGAAWAEHACTLLVQGNIEELVTEIVVLPPVPPEPGASRSVAEIERDYFIANAARMRYPAFRAQGMHVGSGIAEAACKTVVSTRAKRSGMRWTPEGLDAVLALRTAVLNGIYDDFWEEHPRLVA
jgi:hypothetical protein